MGAVAAVGAAIGNLSVVTPKEVDVSASKANFCDRIEPLSAGF
jgi:hypothetical protein